MLVLSPDPEPTNPRTTYDRGVRFNYDQADFDSLVELIGYLKTLTGTVVQAESAIVAAVSAYVNLEIQKMVLGSLDPLVDKARSIKADEALRALTTARDIIAGCAGAPPPPAAKAKTVVQPKETNAMISAHELDVIRAEVHALIRSDSILFSKKKPVLKKDKTAALQAFLDSSYSWYLLVDVIQAVREASNLSSLWFRELHLDLAKKIQFPVRSSLPFILIEHLLTSQNHPELHDSMMFPFEIYNDCAYAALNSFRSQYLYREIEAEVSLSIDMLAFTFSETVFKYCHEAAAAIECPPECAGMFVPKITRYNVMVRQNKLQLLGSAVDFNLVATTKLNQKLRKELESYIETLTDLRLILYVAHLVRVAKTTHTLLLQTNLRMDEFDAIWQRANSFTNAIAIQSNIGDAVLASCDFPRWVYNSDSTRFTSTKQLTITPLRKDGWPVNYANIHSQDLRFLGLEHVRALIDLLTPGELAYVVVGLTNRLETEMFKLVEVYAPVASHLRVTAAKSKDNLANYFSFNTDAYSELVIPNLGSLFNSLRVVGNIVALIAMIDTQLPEGSNSLMPPVLAVVKTTLENNRELFFQTGAFELCNISAHRSFPSLWCVLEELICVPGEVRIDDTRQVQPLATFGDGPAFAAGLFITLAGQENLYHFDSIMRRALALRRVESEGNVGKELTSFLRYGSAVASSMSAADRIAAPYK
jgi:cytoplasmic FMR1 interacting protein